MIAINQDEIFYKPGIKYYVNIDMLLKYTNVEKQEIINLLYQHNGIEIYDIKSKYNISFDNKLKLFLKLKYDINIKCNNIFNDDYNYICFNNAILCSYFTLIDNISINDIRMIYKLFKSLNNIETEDNIIMFNNHYDKDNFIKEYKKLFKKE